MKVKSIKSTSETGRVVVVVRTDCGACEDVVRRVSQAMEIFHQQPRVINLDQAPPVPAPYNTVITPAIFIDRELWAYGSVDQQIIADELKRSLETSEVCSEKKL